MSSYAASPIDSNNTMTMMVANPFDLYQPPAQQEYHHLYHQRSPSQESEWTCPKCSLRNSQVASICEVCREINPAVIQEAARSSTTSPRSTDIVPTANRSNGSSSFLGGQPYSNYQITVPTANVNDTDEDDDNKWACPKCSLLNSRIAPICELCREINPMVVREAATATTAITARSSHAGSDIVSLATPPTISPSNYSNYQLDYYPSPSTTNAVSSPYDYVPYTSTPTSHDLVPDATTTALVERGVSPYGLTEFYGTETYEQRKKRRRTRRRARMTVGGCAGLLVGSVLGPWGAAGGAVAGAAVARKASKIGEQRKDRRVADAERRLALMSHSSDDLQFQ